MAAVEVFGRGVSSSAEELLLGEAQDVVRAQLAKLLGAKDGATIDALRRGVRNALSNLLWNKTHTRRW